MASNPEHKCQSGSEDARHHMLGRLVSVLSEELLNGQVMVIHTSVETIFTALLVHGPPNGGDRLVGELVPPENELQYSSFLRKKDKHKILQGPYPWLVRSCERRRCGCLADYPSENEILAIFEEEDEHKTWKALSFAHTVDD